MGGFPGCKPQVFLEEEDLPILNVVAAHTLAAVVNAKVFLPAVISPTPFQQLQLHSPAVSQLLEALPIKRCRPSKEP